MTPAAWAHVRAVTIAACRWWAARATYVDPPDEAECVRLEDQVKAPRAAWHADLTAKLETELGRTVAEDELLSLLWQDKLKFDHDVGNRDGMDARTIARSNALSGRVARCLQELGERAWTVPKATNPALEAAIADDPDDLARWLVYADWLQAAGDPRGELIVVQEAALGSDAARAREAELLGQHERYLLGVVADARAFVELRFRRGFIHAVTVDTVQFMSDPSLLLAEVLRLPSARFLGELTLPSLGWGEDEGYAPFVRVLREAGPRPTLRRLAIGVARAAAEEPVWTSALDLSPLDGLYPNLRSLVVRADPLVPGSLEFPRLEELQIEGASTSPSLATSLEAGRLPRLRRIDLRGAVPTDLTALRAECAARGIALHAAP